MYVKILPVLYLYHLHDTLCTVFSFPHPGGSWSCAGNWPGHKGLLEEVGGEDPQDTEEGAGQEGPGSLPKDTPPHHFQQVLKGGKRAPKEEKHT